VKTILFPSPALAWEKVAEGRMRAGGRSAPEQRREECEHMPFTPRRQLRRARDLRRDQTSAEARLWAKLRDRRLLGYKFVRQEPIGPFIADFVCREAQLVVEVDGATHSTDEEVAHDRRRTACFASQGYRVVRVGNDDVYQRLDDVLATILAGLKGDL
jgi:very-short-patch-repair endonuclease